MCNYRLNVSAIGPVSLACLCLKVLGLQSLCLTWLAICSTKVCEQHPWHLHGHKFWVVGMGKGTWNGSQEQIDSLSPKNASKRDTITVIPDAVTPFKNKPQQGT